MTEHLTDAYETLGTPGQGPYFITCEHASNRVPAPWTTTPLDRAWLKSHWGYDIGARTVARELVRATGSYGVFARFSRLVVDPNREPEHPDLIRASSEGHHFSFNQRVSAEERARRLARFHAPYHAALDAGLAAHVGSRTEDVLLLSVHTFTPVWNNHVRPMDIGVLYAPYERLARKLAQGLAAEGFETALNQPYSGREGLIYAAHRHGIAHRVHFLELELNQSLTCTPARARKVARRLLPALRRLTLPDRDP